MTAFVGGGEGEERVRKRYDELPSLPRCSSTQLQRNWAARDVTRRSSNVVDYHPVAHAAHITWSRALPAAILVAFTAFTVHNNLMQA